ncbi:MAG: hypothetical protein HZB65_01840 [Candidatus Aenigmarchaeota archaeon]|nr:hypothetical protein [Candidatus Aenigmarchaeota archaeon]
MIEAISRAELLKKNYSIDTDPTESYPVPGLLSTTQVCRVIKEKFGHSAVYIINTPEITAIGSHPSIVGESHSDMCRRAADETFKVLKYVNRDSLDDFINCLVLRAAPGFKIGEAAEQADYVFPQATIRPRYVKPSFRDHDGSAVKTLEILNSDFSKVPDNKELTLLKFDTEASLGTTEKVLPFILEELGKRNSSIKKVIFGGYVSGPSISKIVRLAKKHNFESEIYAWGNVTGLYSNNYDMPVYGPDEALWREKKRISFINSVIPLEILEKYADIFIPGADQPGDWSARQSEVFNGVEYEKGEIIKHLSGSIEFIGNLYKMFHMQKREEQDFGFLDYHGKLMETEISNMQDILDIYLKTRVYVDTFLTNKGSLSFAEGMRAKPVQKFKD